MGLMNLAEIMDKSIEILKKYLTTIIMFSIGYGVIMFLGLIIFTIGASIFAAIALGMIDNVVFTVIVISILVLIVLGFSLTVNIGIIKITEQEFYGERIYASNAVGETFKNIFKVLGITSIAVLLFIPVIGIFSVPTYLIYKFFEANSGLMGENPFGIIMFVVITIICILAATAIIIGYVTMFSFSLQVLTIEKKGVINSVKRSFKLVKNNFWKIYGCIVLFGITVYAIRYSIMSFWALITSIIFMLLKFFSVQQDYTTFITMALTYSNWPISLISWCIISPLGTIMLSVLYFNQRFKKEGYDMFLKLKEIEKSQERDELDASLKLNKSL